jgi:hypothetical protein
VSLTGARTSSSPPGSVSGVARIARQTTSPTNTSGIFRASRKSTASQADGLIVGE